MKAIAAAAVLSIYSATILSAAGIDEFNAWRSRYGYPAVRPNADYMRFAQRKAEWQAAYGIRWQDGFNGHEGPQRDDLCEGTGCFERGADDYGHCGMRIIGSLEVGVGVAISEATGRRHICMVWAVADDRGYYPDRATSEPLLHTAYMTAAPIIPARDNSRIRRDPANKTYTPTYYPFLDGTQPKGNPRRESTFTTENLGAPNVKRRPIPTRTEPATVTTPTRPSSRPPGKQRRRLFERITARRQARRYR